MSRLACLPLLACLLALAPSALAQAPCSELDAEQYATYVQLTEAGKKFAGDKQLAEGREAFVLARKICADDPVVTYNLARIQQLAGECQDAVGLYDTAIRQLAKSSDSALDIGTIEAKLTETRSNCVGTVEVACDESGVTVSIGEVTGLACPAKQNVLAGTLVVRAEKAGKLLLERELSLAPGASELLTVAAEPAPLPPVSEASSVLPIVGWSVGGVGAIALGTGVALHFMAEGKRDEVLEAKKDSPVVDMTQKEAFTAEEDANTLDTTGAILMGVGGALVATGLTFLILDWTSGDEMPAGAVWVAPNGVGLSVVF